MTIVDEVNDTETVVDLTYDATGTPLTLTANGETFYYLTNIMGDVVGFTDANGDLVMTIIYEAYGLHYYFIGNEEKTNLLIQANPLYYRGYVIDRETSLYYLQSRYYDMTFGRFINADAFASTGQGLLGYNMFAYCLNNPVNLIDTSGCYAATITIAGVSISVATLAKILVVLAVVAVWSDPNVQEVISRGFSNVGSAGKEWVDELFETIHDAMVKSLTKAKKPTDNHSEIHHIVPQTDPRGARARFILEYLFPRFGVSYALNLISVDHRIHRRLHTNWYYMTVDSIIFDAFCSAPPVKEEQIKKIDEALIILRGMIKSLMI